MLTVRTFVSSNLLIKFSVIFSDVIPNYYDRLGIFKDPHLRFKFSFSACEVKMHYMSLKFAEIKLWDAFKYIISYYMLLTVKCCIFWHYLSQDHMC